MLELQRALAARQSALDLTGTYSHQSKEIEMTRKRVLAVAALAVFGVMAMSAVASAAPAVYSDFNSPTCVVRNADTTIAPFTTTVSGVPAGQYIVVYLSGNPPAADPFIFGQPYYADGGYVEGNGGIQQPVVGSNQNRVGTPTGAAYVSLAIFASPSRGYETVESIAVQVQAACAPVDPDSDGDGTNDSVDNCPAAANADQANNDGDSAGDVCDSDDDNDTVVDTTDNCPTVANASQTDRDGDGVGTACDTSELPSTVGQCKKDGWRNWYEGSRRFKNQGDCESYLQTNSRS
jgi:Thrombospondin type 3 repeat